MARDGAGSRGRDSDAPAETPPRIASRCGGRIRRERRSETDAPVGPSPSDLAPSSRPRTEPDHPPNLSILISGGKETNGDAPSSGERRGHRSSLKSDLASRGGTRIVVFEPAVDDARRGGVVGPSDLERSAAEGESPVSRASASPSSSTETMSSSASSRVGLFEIAALKRVVDPIQS